MMANSLCDLLSIFVGLCLLLFDLTWSATLAVTEAPTVVYGDLTSCISFGELDIVVDVNLTDPDTNQEKEYITEFHLPEDVYQAKCDSQASHLSLITQDGILEVHLVLKPQVDDSNYASLTVTDITVNSQTDSPEHDKSDHVILSKRGNASKNKTLSYESSYNETIECNKQNQKVIFHSPRAQAAIVFSQVRLQPYSKFVRLDNGKGILCPHDLDPIENSTAHSEIFIPLILAVALTVVILLIVIGYFVHKKIEGMGYTSME